MSYQTELFKQLKAAGITQTELSKILGIKQPSISKFKNGKAPLPEKQAIRIAEVLGLNKSDVLALLAADQAEDEEVKNAWLKLVTGTAAALVITPISSITNFVQCIFINKGRFNTYAL